ncbi:MAG: restriction endonuclease subunit S, partial [Peptoniphilaceae bacterium]|nr:restriction endonuclease subunit S [Peptoniphilaceae bacterium]MCI6660039.1 restriction endonuclease subunit S [Peptoniphilaceae bacterium]MDD7433519.1 restriction endonuclease subunit S [Peptoniphilaceae bacterium]MDY3075732.1 restriction endonuclease subunit S [Peptoniphilaceae bacterium]MDY4196209.1 restriction endonuclease subunit S [Peptoniphilaceae bacterium]
MKCIEDEIPFELPDGWAWARLGNIGEWKAGATPNRKCLEYYNGDIPWVKTGDLNDDYIKEIPETITKKALKETSVSIIPKDTVLIAMYGATIGKLGITTCDVTTNQACCACCNLKGVNKKFLFYFLMQHKSNFISMGFGGAQPNISKEKIVQVIIPVPPIEEQNKITAKLTELFTFVKKIESAKSTLQSTIQQTKSKILDLAIRGKLVPQDPNDESASVLLERIRAEKEELIKQGKIKRDKKESVIFK